MKVKTSHVETWITGGHCCYMLMALERHFPRGCSWSSTWTTLLSLPLVTGEGRKGIPGIIWGGGGGRRRGPVIHNACYLTQHTDLLLTRTGLYLRHQCHHMTTVHDKALFAKRRVKHSTTIMQQHWIERWTLLKHRSKNYIKGNSPFLYMSSYHKSFILDKSVLKGAWTFPFFPP